MPTEAHLLKFQYDFREVFTHKLLLALCFSDCSSSVLTMYILTHTLCALPLTTFVFFN